MFHSILENLTQEIESLAHHARETCTIQSKQSELIEQLLESHIESGRSQKSGFRINLGIAIIAVICSIAVGLI